MNRKFRMIFILILSMQVAAQKHQKSKMFLDKTYKIDSSLQSYFGIQLEPINGIAIIDEHMLKENTENVITEELHATRDPFISALLFQFSAMHFNAKGLARNYSSITLNGIPMIDLSNGSGSGNLWQGLNGLFKVDENNNGFLPNSFSVATVGTTSNLDNRASKQKAETNFEYGFSNRAFTHRIQVIHSTGMQKHNWAFTVSAGGQLCSNPQIPGTFHQTINGFLGVDKRFNKQLFSLAFFVSNIQNARQGYTLKESTTMFDNPLYNPNWGFQHQEIRNANISSQLLPVAMFTHEWDFSNQSYIQTAIAFSTGGKNNTALNWFHAPDPRPDYYRYLPSFQSDPILKDWITQTLKQDLNQRQINWDKLIEINRNSYEKIYDANGIIGNTISGKMAKYFVENRRTDSKRISAASSFHGIIGNTLLFDIGFSTLFQQQHYYKTVNDLLGADFFVNWNQFAENEIPNNANAIQFDMEVPNRIIKVGDPFGYDYSILNTKMETWMSTVLPFKHFRFSLAGLIGRVQFWRIGNKINGLFPNNSLGKSMINQFLNTGIKLGINYSINGKQNLYISIANRSDAPNSDNSFISPSSRDTEQEMIKNEISYAAELGYMVQSKNLKMHASLYYIQSFNGMDMLSFYHDTYNSFVNYAISGIGQKQAGYEFGMEARLNNHFSLITAATNGNHIFNTRQFAIVTVDNNATEIERDIIYAKNYPSINSPQSAYSLTLNVRTNNQWFGSLSASLFDKQYLGWNPIRRTAAAIYPIDPLTEKGQSILQVDRLPAQSFINCFLSHSFRWNKKKQEQFSYSMSINNLLNRQDIILAGFEQLRYDFENKDPNKFPPKYVHASGRNFLLSLRYSF